MKRWRNCKLHMLPMQGEETSSTPKVFWLGLAFKGDLEVDDSSKLLLEAKTMQMPKELIPFLSKK